MNGVSRIGRWAAAAVVAAVVTTWACAPCGGVEAGDAGSSDRRADSGSGLNGAIDASIADSGPSDAGDAQDAGTQSCLRPIFDAPVNSSIECHVDDVDWNTAACVSAADEGAVVIRDEVCFASGVGQQCVSGVTIFPLYELVVLCDPFGGCDWPITVDTIEDCDDHIELRYTVTKPCVSCRAVLPLCTFLVIGNSPKPVRATGQLVEQCP